MRGRIYGLDLIRGIAILLVLLRHAWPEVFGGAGIAGVVLFFALSGYLITGNLVKDIHNNGRVRYGQFYLHRAFRLIPPLMFMLAGFTAVSVIWDPLGDRSELLRSNLVALTYTANVPGFDKGSDALSHLWTLATEEQFYLAWPLVLMMGIRWRRPLFATAVAGMGVFALTVATVVVAAPDVERVYSLPTSWAVSMLMGAFAFLAKDAITSALDRSPVTPATLSVVALLVLTGVSVLPELKDWAGTYLLIGPVVSLCSLSLIFAWTRLDGPVPTWLKPLHFLGLISYAAYLWNYPVAVWAGHRPLTIAQGLLTIGATILLATLSKYMVEDPVGKLRRTLDARLTDREARPANSR